MAWAEGGVVAELEVLVARDAVGLADGGEGLGLLDGVDCRGRPRGRARGRACPPGSRSSPRRSPSTRVADLGSSSSAAGAAAGGCGRLPALGSRQRARTVGLAGGGTGSDFGCRRMAHRRRSGHRRRPSLAGSSLAGCTRRSPGLAPCPGASALDRRAGRGAVNLERPRRAVSRLTTSVSHAVEARRVRDPVLEARRVVRAIGARRSRGCGVWRSRLRLICEPKPAPRRSA